MNSSKNQPVSERRKFFLDIARAAGLAILGGLTWSAFVDEVKATSLILRPPGALDEDDFLATCIKCGMCVEACPFNTLKLAKPGDNKPLGTPFFIPREIPCYMCVDIPCVPVCPTDALNGQASTHIPHLIHVAKKSSSSSAPGGLKISEVAFTSSTKALHVKPPSIARPVALAMLRKNFLLSLIGWLLDVFISFFSFF